MAPAVGGADPSVAVLSLACLRQQLADALGPDVGVAVSGVDGDPSQLFSSEQPAINRAIARRQREFAAGRVAARAAMAQLGWPATAIPVAPDRSPIWPEGLVGSIAHSAQLCVAIVARCADVHAVGIDIEEDRPLDPTLWPTICTPGELAAIALLPATDQGQQVTRLFCSKEAFYKWQYPQTGRLLDFCDVNVSLNPDHTGFAVHPADLDYTIVPACALEGRLLTSQGCVLAWLTGPPALQRRDG